MKIEQKHIITAVVIVAVIILAYIFLRKPKKKNLTEIAAAALSGRAQEAADNLYPTTATGQATAMNKAVTITNPVTNAPINVQTKIHAATGEKVNVMTTQDGKVINPATGMPISASDPNRLEVIKIMEAATGKSILGPGGGIKGLGAAYSDNVGNIISALNKQNYYDDTDMSIDEDLKQDEDFRHLHEQFIAAQEVDESSLTPEDLNEH